MASEPKRDLTILPIDEVSMPTEDVSDLRDVVDAINKLCETMKTSYDDNEYEDCSELEHVLVDPTEVVVTKVETFVAETWSDPSVEESMVSDSEPITVEAAQCEPISEMYYTASSEVSLLSDTDFLDRGQSEDSDKERDDRNSVMAGHVAAMRERFESMTRTNTPCPDLIRSLSPSFEVIRNISTSPDLFDRS